MRTKVFQREANDCAKAGLATLLRIPYEDGPDLWPENCWDCTVKWKDHWSKAKKVLFSAGNIDGWFKRNNLKIKVVPYWKFAWPWEYSLGICIRHDWPKDAWMLPTESHVVVLRGKKIWHDPSGVDDPVFTQVVFRVKVKREY